MATSMARPVMADRRRLLGPRRGRYRLQDHGRRHPHHAASLRLQHRGLRPRRAHPGHRWQLLRHEWSLAAPSPGRRRFQDHGRRHRQHVTCLRLQHRGLRPLGRPHPGHRRQLLRNDGSSGTFGGGTVFKLTAAGALTTLHAFDGNTGGCVSPRPHPGHRWHLHGTTGAARRRTAPSFKLTAAGTVTTLHAFDCSTAEGCTPAGLIQATDGNFYGRTEFGAATVFKLTSSGGFTTLLECLVGCGPNPASSRPATATYTARSVGPGGPRRPPRGGARFRLVGRLSGPARVWIGLKNSDDVGLRLDLLAEVFVDGTKVGEGRVNNVGAGSSGFNSAGLNAIPLALSSGPVDFPVVTPVEVKVSVRRTCSAAGTPRAPRGSGTTARSATAAPRGMRAAASTSSAVTPPRATSSAWGRR